MTLPPVASATPPQRLKGRHIWGGLVFAHFGHFICETISRLWAIRHHEVDGIVMIGRHKDVDAFRKWQVQLLELLDVKLPITIVSEPTEIDELIVPGQGFGLGRIARGTPEFHDFVRPLAERIKPQGSGKLYISRSKEGKKGRILNEPSVERNLARAGYQIFHPSRHQLEAQLAHYIAAERIVGLDSSAFHLCGLVARPEQHHAIILRRNMGAYINIQRQLAGFGGREPDIIDVLVGDWMKKKQKTANRESWGELDHDALRDRLVETGYLSPEDKWTSPSDEGREENLTRLRGRLEDALVFRPIQTRASELMADKA